MLQNTKKNLQKTPYYIRKHWKACMVIFLVLLTIALVMLFPVPFAMFFGGLGIIGPNILEMLGFMLVSDIIYFSVAAAAFWGVVAGASVLLLSVGFNALSWAANPLCDWLFKDLWQKNKLGTSLVVITVLAVSIATAVATNLWVIPVLVIGLQVAVRVAKWLDWKINPRCELIYLDPKKINPDGPINPNYLTKRFERSYYLIGEDFYRPINHNNVTMFQKLNLKDKTPDDKGNIGTFRGKFQSENRKCEHGVKKEVSFLKLRDWIRIDESPISVSPSPKPVSDKNYSNVPDEGPSETKRASPVPIPRASNLVAPKVSDSSIFEKTKEEEVPVDHSNPEYNAGPFLASLPGPNESSAVTGLI